MKHHTLPYTHSGVLVLNKFAELQVHVAELVEQFLLIFLQSKNFNE